MIPVKVLMVLQLDLLKQIEKTQAELEENDPKDLNLLELVEVGKKLAAARAKTEIAEKLMTIIDVYSGKEEA